VVIFDLEDLWRQPGLRTDLDDAGDGGKGWHDIRSPFDGQFYAGVVDEVTVLDGVDPGAQRGGDPGGADGVRGAPEAETVR
jgi:hypothetical protein